MRQGHAGWIGLLCLAVGSGACASRKEGADMAASRETEGALPGTSLRCELSVAPRLKVGEPVMVTFRLTNPTGQPLSVLSWHTPLEGLRSNHLEITREGTEIPYQGPMFKRGDPGADDYITLAPGASAGNTIEASLAYDFSQPGTYRITFPGPLRDVATQQAEVPRPLAQHRRVPVQCPPAGTQIAAP